MFLIHNTTLIGSSLFDCASNNFCFEATILEKCSKNFTNCIFCSSYLFFQSYEKINLETDPINKDQSTALRKIFDFIKQIEELGEPYRANNCNLSDNEILKEVFPGCHAAFLLAQMCN